LPRMREGREEAVVFLSLYLWQQILSTQVLRD
jgi:hypothetical protein